MTAAGACGLVALTSATGCVPRVPVGSVGFAVYGRGVPTGTPRCTAPDYRAWDFWVGRWTIQTANGAPSGTSRIESVLGGCAILETFAGGQGVSLSAFDRATGEWRQDYVDFQGLTLRLHGGLRDGAMRLADSVRVIPGGPSLRSRFAWQRDSLSGEVRQTWWFSTDGGATERVNFDGRYTRATTVPVLPPPVDTVCRGRPAYRRLDAWLGAWRVIQAGRLLGHATLSSEAGGCLMRETFAEEGRRSSLYRLEALLYFDRYIGVWYRAQADVTGQVHRLGGSLRGDTLVVSGFIPGVAPGTLVPARLEWFSAGTDTLRQRWVAVDSVAADGGRTRWVETVWIRAKER